ncbi:MAG: alpha-L-fucosidase, partial [Verrucomicrobia bacterium]|nr:alpha-L-fucosidase [Verrucomicrobiota bacterium]
MRLLALAMGLGLAVVASAAETRADRDSRMQWWREARFGMFVNWGVYSVPAGIYQGKPVADRGERIMSRAKIPPAEYAKFLDQFDPDKFNARELLRIAKSAGIKYIIATAKHHDGFAMFRSKTSSFNVYDATPFKRDPLDELAEACRKEGMKLGFYYSQAQDWHHPGGAVSGGRWDPAQDGNMDDYIEKIAVPQVREMLTAYGDVAALWWDTPQDMTPDRAARFLPLLKLQPQILTNNRLGGNVPGHFSTLEQYVPPLGLPGRDWETCMAINDSWGYKRDDNKWKSAQQLIHSLVDVASKGGNYVVVVGPTGEGVIPVPVVERLKAVGEWMRINGEAIYATTAGPLPSLGWGRCTRRVDGGNTTLYLHVFNWPGGGKLLVPDLKNEPVKAYLLADEEKKPLAAAARADGVVVSVPAQAPDPNASVVVLQVKGEVPAQPYVVA